MPPETACTTFLFVGVRPNGTGICAQLGDGLIGRTLGDEFVPLSPERATFGSVTLALGAPHSGKDWVITPVLEFAPGTSMLLATDGISDDLKPESIAGFVAWLIADFSLPDTGGVRLRRALRQWPVPHHRDDKTLVLLWNPSEQ